MEQSFDLDTRTGLPADLKELLREISAGDMDRPCQSRRRRRSSGSAGTTCSANSARRMQDALSQHREGRVELDPFRRWFAPRLDFFLRELEGHHQIEDHHYFPVFQRAEARLAHGFDLLEIDHEVIHQDLMAVAETANRFLAMEAAARKLAVERGAPRGRRLCRGERAAVRRLIRHLADEEDLIIPLILDRGEAAIGI